MIATLTIDPVVLSANYIISSCMKWYVEHHRLTVDSVRRDIVMSKSSFSTCITHCTFLLSDYNKIGEE